MHLTNSTEDQLIKRANAYKETLSFFWLAAVSPKIKSETNEILEDYTTLLRIRKEQDPSNPKVDVPQSLSLLVSESMAYIAAHSDLNNLYAMSQISSESFLKTKSNYEIWYQKRQRG